MKDWEISPMLEDSIVVKCSALHLSSARLDLDLLMPFNLCKSLSFVSYCSRSILQQYRNELAPMPRKLNKMRKMQYKMLFRMLVLCIDSSSMRAKKNSG
ncbi:hypothetical protein F506_19060 [Herbaspirillum hiltneri N3]|uniref:Uncharacterized protein n=1 Tax=Herbaspirillum hiltneri N3 TaxID=1262470 RepID=A0ABM5V4F5_9BURK|nr:hypothetical protein F506_19060 [Herbaspirillum hiltneri N3]